MLETLAEHISTQHSIWVLVGLKVMIVASVFLPAISVIAMFSIWWERKVAGHVPVSYTHLTLPTKA